MHESSDTPALVGAHGEDALGVANLLANLQRGLFGKNTADPARVGRYLLLGRIGSGGVGVVYAAYDPELDRRVAIKLLSRGRLDDTRWRARLAREAQAMARIDHPNVVRVYDVGTFGGDGEASGVFIVMELIEGQTMAAWLQRHRTWSEVVKAFIQAGRGVAAAHQRGLIHRDFKPGNVIIGPERVCVLDFGLARASQQSSTDVERQERRRQFTGPHGALITSLTKTGSVMGTPPYMAPEQHRGIEVDHRTDQYAFCVALFQGLYDAWPFEGDTTHALARAKERTAPATVRRRGVPNRVHAALLRGLSPDPRDRFRCLEDLIRELERAVARPRRRRAVAVAGGVSFGLLAAGAAYANRPDDGCDAAARRVETTWNAKSAAAVTDAFAATELAFAPVTAERTTAALDRYADAMTRSYVEVCEDVDKRDDPDHGAEQRFCLDQRAAELGALVQVLRRPDPQTVGKALSAVRKLQEPARCLDQAYASSLLEGVASDAEREALAAFKAEAAAVRSAFDAGRYAEALVQAEALVEHADGMGQRRSVAEAKYLQALVLQYLSPDERAAADELEAAALMLRATRQPALEFEAWIQLAPLLAGRFTDIERAEQAMRHAEAASEAGGEVAQDRVSLWRVRGIVHAAAGNYVEAEAALWEALALAELLDLDEERLASTLNTLATVLRHQGRADESVRMQQRALSVAEVALGENHPDLAAFHSNLASAYKAMKLPKVALPHQQRAVELFTIVSGEANQQVLAALTNLAGIHYALRDFDKAEEVWREVLDELGDDGRPETRAQVLNNLGVLANDAGRHDEAVELQRSALALKSEAFGSRHPSLVSTYHNLGLALLDGGRPADARPYLQEGAELAAGTLGPDHAKTLELLEMIKVAEEAD